MLATFLIEMFFYGEYDFEIPLLKQWVRERAVRS